MATNADPELEVHVPEPTAEQLSNLAELDTLSAQPARTTDEEDEDDKTINIFDKEEEEEEDLEEGEPQVLGGFRKKRKRKRKLVLHLLLPENLEKKHEKPPVIHYNLIMHCNARHQRQEKVLLMSAVPVTVNEIKEAIEYEFDIPMCTQMLQFGDATLQADEKVAQHDIQDGSTLQVTYYAEGELQKVKVISSWINYLYTLIKNRHPCISTEVGADADIVAGIGFTEGLWEILREDLFCPREDPRAISNKRYFNQHSGVHSIINNLTVLIQESWRTQPLRLKLIECDFLRILASYASHQEFEKMVKDLDGVGYAVQSFTRVKLRRGMPAVDSSGSLGRMEHNDFLVKELVESAMEVLWTFREEYQVHEDVTSSYEVIEQLITIIHCPSFSTLTGLMAACIISCCAQTENVSKGLCRSNCLDGMLDAAQTRLSFGVALVDINIFNYLTQVLLAHVVMFLPEHVSKDTFEKIHKFMERFLRNTAPEDVHQRLLEIEQSHEVKIGWRNYLHTIKLVYGRDPQEELPSRVLESSGKMITKLRELAVETAFFVLQVMVRNAKSRDFLMEQDVYGYLIALPGYIPASSRKICKDFFEYYGRHVKFSPPKLSILARARLGKAHYSIIKAMGTPPAQMKAELYPPPPRPPPIRAPLPNPIRTANGSLCYIIALR